MSHELIAKKLEKAMGLHAPTVGMVTISSAIDKRMRACSIDNDEAYLIYINSNIAEMKELIETVIIPETWFFRENEPYSYVLKYIESQPKITPTKILSMPCSTGEEPYSIAMMLIESGLASSKYTIDAVDIAEKNINHAKQGQYRKNSFRSQDLGFVENYFHKDNDTFILSDSVKQKVNFHCGNVLDYGFHLNNKEYDVIFCRNLLIYFDFDTQQRMFSTLDRMLSSTGILILGHAETVQNSDGYFLHASNAKSCIYVKKGNIKNLNIANHKEKFPIQNKINSQPKPIKVSPIPFAEHRNTTTKSKDNVQNSSNKQLELAFEMANQGLLNEALIHCEKYLQEHNDSSRAYYLSGVIYDAQGSEDKANEYLRKAIYLDPHNIEALIHLSLLVEQRGNHAEATRLKQRAERVKERRAG